MLETLFLILQRGCVIIGFVGGIDTCRTRKMWRRELFISISLMVFLFSGSWAIAACPSADLISDKLAGVETDYSEEVDQLGIYVV